MYEIHYTDNLAWLQSQPDDSIHSVVTDPPYGLGKEPDPVKMLAAWLQFGYLEVKGAGFMGRRWDAFVPQPIFWKEVFRVLKPGGHVLSFGGARTYDWMVMAMRLAGFEVRDQLMWIYGGGFPKSMDAQQAMAKAGHGLVPEWEGWGTALSPSHEPIVMARKPLIGTVAENIFRHGTGAINIDACRVPTEDGQPHYHYANGAGGNGFHGGIGRESDGTRTGIEDTASPLGRWPSNIILDGSDDVSELFPYTQNGFLPQDTKRSTGGGYSGSFPKHHIGARDSYGDSGSAARYFYHAKASKYERNLGVSTPGGNNHPTVKPVALMHHLVMLVTPANGIVLDPYFGSGTTGIGAMLAGGGINCIGLESDPKSIEIALVRCKNWRKYRQFIEVKKTDAKARRSSKNQNPTLF